MQDQEIWHQKWASNQIGFHLTDVNPVLIEHWKLLEPSREKKVFVPLCGKSEDLVWLAKFHEDVQGVELSDIAVRAFFAEQFYTPTVTTISGQHELYQFDELSIYTGDYFTAPIQPVDLVYDRAALIALPKEIRREYVERLKSLLLPGGKILLVSLDYDQKEMTGPPFSVPETEIHELFSGFKVTRVSREDADESHPRIQKGLTRFAEEVWVIEPEA